MEILWDKGEKIKVVIDEFTVLWPAEAYTKPDGTMDWNKICERINREAAERKG